MGLPTSEVGYTPAMPRREDLEFHKDMWGIGQKYQWEWLPTEFTSQYFPNHRAPLQHYIPCVVT